MSEPKPVGAEWQPDEDGQTRWQIKAPRAGLNLWHDVWGQRHNVLWVSGNHTPELSQIEEWRPTPKSPPSGE